MWKFSCKIRSRHDITEILLKVGAKHNQYLISLSTNNVKIKSCSIHPHKWAEVYKTRLILITCVLLG